MKNLIQAAVVTLLAASTAQGQQAVQWRVEDGGNGHWYQGVFAADFISRTQSTEITKARGGTLVSIGSADESAWVFGVVASRAELWTLSTPFALGPWIGARRVSGQWNWDDGTKWNHTDWLTNEPNDTGDYAHYYNSTLNPGGSVTIRNTWNDNYDTNVTKSLVIEWSADCNGDGIVDYGQCHDGTLADYNGNNIPDCCERGEACVVGNYPVQWRVEDGGNGHWYRLVFDGHPSWTEAKQLAEQLGGYLATLTSKSENDLGGVLSRGATAMLLGGFQDRASQDYSEPAGGWRWITGEPWTFTNWGSGEPNDANNGHGDPGEDYLSSWTGGQGFRWGDGDNICPECNPGPFLVEWSADCNNDNIVDYGQILQGQLADLDSNGVPDICQQPTCVAADIYRDFNVNGADLGILLSQWGPNTPLTESDLNSDGVVNGADLGILLSFWGACP
jgi:hypothetical protein